MALYSYPVHAPLGGSATLQSAQATVNLTPFDPDIAVWYNAPQNANMPSPLAPAQVAYNEATKYFNGHLTRDECKRIWLADKATMEDAMTAVEAARSVYEKRSRKGKPREWLLAFSSRVMHYKGVMDTLAQHHPEYVSLAWGAMKFLFMGLLNHEELITCIAKTLSQIAIVLPRAELDLNLYGHPRILSEVSQLYAHIIRFVQAAVSWYQKGKIAHGVASILKPFPIMGKEIVEEIEQCSARVDKLAASANRAETRGLHLKTVQLEQLIIGTQRLSLQSIKDARNDQLTRISLLPVVKSLPPASETLTFQIAMRNRHRKRELESQDYAHLIPSLNQWAYQDHRLLMVSGRKDPKSPQHFAIDLIQEVQRSPIPIIWALSNSRLHGTETTLTDVLRLLTVQALQISRSATEDFVVSPAEIELTTAHDEWLKLLSRALRGLKQVYVVVDTDILKGSARSRNQHRAVELMGKLLRESRSDGLDLKIIITVRKFLDEWENCDEEEPHILRLHSIAQERRGNRRGTRVPHTARGRASILPIRRGRAKRFTGLAGQLLISGPSP